MKYLLIGLLLVGCVKAFSPDYNGYFEFDFDESPVDISDKYTNQNDKEKESIGSKWDAVRLAIDDCTIGKKSNNKSTRYLYRCNLKENTSKELKKYYGGKIKYLGCTCDDDLKDMKCYFKMPSEYGTCKTAPALLGANR